MKGEAGGKGPFESCGCLYHLFVQLIVCSVGVEQAEITRWKGKQAAEAARADAAEASNATLTAQLESSQVRVQVRPQSRV